MRVHGHDQPHDQTLAGHVLPHPAHLGAATATKTDARLAWRINSYHPRWRAAVSDLAYRIPHAADLADSYPALLFALSSGFGMPNARAAAVAQLAAGAPLTLIAETLGLAWWTRKLPAVALLEPLPPFPLDADFARRMANLVPTDASQCRPWLACVSQAVLSGGRSYGLWAGRHGVALSGTLGEQQQHILHAWVWLGWHPGTFGHALIRRPWSAEHGIKRILDEFTAFTQRVTLADALGTDHACRTVPDGPVDGFTFQTLSTPFDYIRAAAQLDNCLEQYGERLAQGTCSVALILANGRPVGCVEIGPHPTERTMPAIVQLRIAKNQRAPAAMWRAAYTWLGRHDVDHLAPGRLAPAPAERADVRLRLWGGYLADLAATPGGAAIATRAHQALCAAPPYTNLHASGVTPTPTLLWQRATEPWPDVTLLERLANLIPRTINRRIPRG
jgi:hypothetical protein